MPISERSFRVHSVFGKLRIGILLVSSSRLPKAERDHRVRVLINQSDLKGSTTSAMP
jgi:hypothetical protein